MSTTETPQTTVFRISGSSFSLRLVAAAILLLFFYYAAGVVITLLLSVLIAYFLDPAVEFLERLRVPRTIGALILVVLMILVLVAVGYTLWLRTSDFAADWPKYRDILRGATGEVQKKLSGFEGSTLPPETRTRPPLVLTANLLGMVRFTGLFTSTTKGRPGG